MKMSKREPDCYCHTCSREMHHLGIARHRAMHRDKQEQCSITFSTGVRKSWDFRPRPAAQTDGNENENENEN